MSAGGDKRPFWLRAWDGLTQEDLDRFSERLREEGVLAAEGEDLPQAGRAALLDKAGREE